MNRLKYILRAKNQYNIQSPFVYDLYENVIAPRLDSATLARIGAGRHDRFAQLCFKLADHYDARETDDDKRLASADVRLLCPDGSLIAIVRRPHSSTASEQAWECLFKDPDATLSVDIYDVGLVFTSQRLARQHFLFREF